MSTTVFGRTSSPPEFPAFATLAGSYVAFLALVALGARSGVPNLTTRAAVDLATSVLWFAAALRWAGTGDADTRRFWRLTAGAAVGVGGYCLAGGIGDLTATNWLGPFAALSAMSSVPLLLTGLLSRSARQEGRTAGWSTVLDVAIIVLSIGGMVGPALIAPAFGFGDLRLKVLSAVWLVLLFGFGAYLLAAFRVPVDRSPAGLLLMSGMLAMLTVGGFAGAVVVGQTDALPPWWVDAMYGIGVLIGIEAPRFDRRINAPARAVARWSMVRMTLPYVAFVPLMVATFFAALIAPATDLTKSLAVTLAVVSGLVAAREMLQVLENRHLAAASLAMLETSRLNEAKVDRLSRVKSEVMANLSHEFRNALVGIQGFSELMKDQELDAAEVKEFAGDIYTDATRLTRMITEMLDVDRMEAGRITLTLKPLDLNTKVRDAVERAQLASAKCPIRMQLDPALPPARADDDRIFQVISNLLSNAIKYSPEGGEVLVTTASSEGNILFSVHDHGIGIAPEDLPRLFQRFERISSAGKKIVGTGLGLVIARQIVELHGGRIWAESTPGVGSEFCFTIPIASPLAPAASPRHGQPTAA